MQLDRLIHSTVDLADPGYLRYTHEQVQMEFFRHRLEAGRGRVLVIGGGGYTFPRAVRTAEPNSEVTVVEIDPGVTAVATEQLGLDPKWGLQIVHQDGRQYLAEQAPAGGFDLITLDAVNDLSVPAHLMTRECHRLAGRALAPGGVYLVSLIDRMDRGRVWAAALATLRQEFPHVRMLQSEETPDPSAQRVYVMAASYEPIDIPAIHNATMRRQLVPYTQVVPAAIADPLFEQANAPILTDQYAPIDNLMAEIFRNRKGDQ
jgi:spermidine synthase